MTVISRMSYSIYLVTFIVFFYFSATLKSSEEFHVLSYLDRMETCIVFVTAFLFTLVVDLPTQNIVKMILNLNFFTPSKSSDEVKKEKEEEKPAEDDIEDIFANKDDDFVYRPKPRYNFDDNSNGE